MELFGDEGRLGNAETSIDAPIWEQVRVYSSSHSDMKTLHFMKHLDYNHYYYSDIFEDVV